MRRALAFASLLVAFPGPARAQEVELPAELTLEIALRLGRTHQPQLRQARGLVAAADARVDEARAALLPQVNINAGYTRSTANFSPRPGSFPNMPLPAPTFSTTTYNFFTAGITASQLLWDFGQAWQRRNAARAAADAEQGGERARQLAVDLGIRNAFFTARAARDAVSVAREALANRTRHVEQVRAFTEVGTRPEIDLLQVLTDQANAEVRLIEAENGYATSRALLNQAMGVVAPASYQVSGAHTDPLPGEEGALAALVDEALQARPEIAAQDARVRAQDLSNRAIAARYYPSLGAVAGLTTAGRETDRLAWNFSGGLTLSWPVIEGGLVRATQREGDATISALRAELDLVRQDVRVEVDSARLTIAAAKASLAASDRALGNARARLDLAEIRYRTGVGSGIELADAQLAATNAAFAKLQATLRLDTARAQLQQALGRP